MWCICIWAGATRAAMMVMAMMAMMAWWVEQVGSEAGDGWRKARPGKALDSWQAVSSGSRAGRQSICDAAVAAHCYGASMAERCSLDCRYLETGRRSGRASWAGTNAASLFGSGGDGGANRSARRANSTGAGGMFLWRQNANGRRWTGQLMAGGRGRGRGRDASDSALRPSSRPQRSSSSIAGAALRQRQRQRRRRRRA